MDEDEDETVDKRAGALTCLALTTLLAGCSSSHGASGGPSPSPTGGTTTTVAPTVAATGGPVATAAPVVPPAPVVQPVDGPPLVIRPGASPSTARLSATPGTVQGRSAAYPDGVQVSGSDVRTGVVTTTGAGAVTGQPVTRLTLTVKNGGRTALDLSHVVVTLMVGPGPVAAAPVYDQTLQDLSGTLTAGASASQDYAFSVPTDQRGQVHLYVDLDAAHLPAVLLGTV